MSKTSSEVKDRYNKKAYDTIILRVSKGQKEIIQQYAESNGKSLNGFITEAINKIIRSDTNCRDIQKNQE